jgi:hypothetical protein
MSNSGTKTVCFAEVPEAMRSYKENLMSELEKDGWSISELLNTKHQIDKAGEILEQCSVVIHILDREDQSYNSNGQSLEEQQIDISVQYLRSQKLNSESLEDEIKIFVWQPRSSNENNFEDEIIPPEYVQRIQQLDEIEFLRTNYEDFKYYLIHNMEDDTKDLHDKIQNEVNSNLSIYFIYDKVDEEIAKEYIEYLKKRKFIVYSPDFDGDIVEVRQAHQNFLMKMDVSIIVAKEVSANWVNMKMMDVLKSAGFGKANEIIGKAVIASDQNRKELTLMNRGFDFFSLNQNTAKQKLFDFLKKMRLPTV